jgi:hypothetical protein
VAALDDKPTIQVRGYGTVRTEPDEALLWITLTTRTDSPGPALADVSARSQALAALLDELRIAKADRTTTGLTVSEEFDHNHRRSLGHRATARVALRLTDPDLIGQLVARAAGELDARVEGPRWQIAADNPVRLDAAREAARDAERKARAYAEGLGTRLGPPLRATDEVGRRPSNTPLAWVAAGGGGDFDPVSVEAGEHEVSASIEVTFALELDGARA